MARSLHQYMSMNRNIWKCQWTHAAVKLIRRVKIHILCKLTTLCTLLPCQEDHRVPKYYIISIWYPLCGNEVVRNIWALKYFSLSFPPWGRYNGALCHYRPGVRAHAHWIMTPSASFLSSPCNKFCCLITMTAAQEQVKYLFTTYLNWQMKEQKCNKIYLRKTHRSRFAHGNVNNCEEYLNTVMKLLRQNNILVQKHKME